MEGSQETYWVWTLIFHFSGLVADLKDVHMTQVALGKAHAVALTNKGLVYTFGINNKGQCGRDFVVQVKEGKLLPFEDCK